MNGLKSIRNGFDSFSSCEAYVLDKCADEDGSGSTAGGGGIQVTIASDSAGVDISLSTLPELVPRLTLDFDLVTEAVCEGAEAFRETSDIGDAAGDVVGDSPVCLNPSAACMSPDIVETFSLMASLVLNTDVHLGESNII